MLGLQLCPFDADQALALARLIADLEPSKRVEVDVIVSARKDTPEPIVSAIAATLRPKFGRVFRARAQSATGAAIDEHPDSCFGVWSDTLYCAWGQSKLHKTKATGILTFEPDCIPVKRDWIDQLSAEWDRALAEGKQVVGHLHQWRDSFHINGNAIFHVRMLEFYPALRSTKAGMPWDIYHQELIVPLANDSTQILQYYRMKEFTQEHWEGLEKRGVRPAFFHGIKTLDGIRIARQMLL
jgi:hypothetical protein